jgi:pimeloyl-ACP methyl ester carboxylesterase
MSTYLLVHGAWHSGQAWDRVAPRLTAAGHEVSAPSLTGHGEKAQLLSREVGLDTHIDDIVRLIVEDDLTDVILVGHSYAGLVISAGADQVPERIAELVYLDAMVPEDGESACDVMPVTKLILDAAKSSSDWRIPPPQPASSPGLFGVTDPADVAWLRSILSDDSVRCFQQSVRLGNPASSAIPRTHIHCTADLPPGYTRRPVPGIQPNGTPAQVWELPTGHDCMITMPAELTDLLLKLG